MAKAREGTEGAKSGATTSERRLRKLERRLENIRELASKRARPVEEARQKAAALETVVVPLREAQPRAGEPAAPSTGPRAYCLREKRTVEMANPQPITMRNGRAALSGICPSCGIHLVTTARPPGA